MATAKLYGNFLISLLNKEIDMNSDTIKVALCTSSYTPNQDTHNYFDDITNELTTGSGYTAGGATIGTVTCTYDAGTNTVKIDGADVTWSASTLTARYAIIYDSTPGTSATNPLIGYVDFTTDQSSSSGDFTITWDSAGIATMTVA
jgi:hypothetical protein